MRRNIKLIILMLLLGCSLTSIVIKEIEFIGLASFSKATISAEINSRVGQEFDQKIANNDSERINDFYQKNKIFNVVVEQPEIAISNDQKVTLRFHIVEKSPIVLNEIYLSGNNLLSSKYILDNLYKHDFLLSDIPDIMEDIGDIYTEKGFIFVDVSFDRIIKREEKNLVEISIKEGKRATLNELIIRGNRVTKPATVKKIINLSPNTILTPDIIAGIEEQLTGKPYIKSSTVLPINSDQLLIDIVEDRMTLLSGILGYSNNNDDKLSGFVNLTLLNLFGTDRKLEFQWQNSNSGNEKIYFSYHESGLNRYPISGDFLISREEQDSTSITTTFSNEIYYQYQQNRFGVLFGWESLYPGSRKPEIVSNSSAIKAGFMWQYTSIDNELNPTRGQYLSTRFYTHWRELDGDNIRKQAIESDLQIYHPLFFPTIISGRINIKTFENKDITEYDYFEAGGLTSIRGYNDNQFKGFRLGWINLELRYLLSRDSRIFIFCDAGYVESMDQIRGDLMSFGLGLRVMTRLGLLGIDYGLGKEEDGFRNPLDGIIHFGIETKL